MGACGEAVGRRAGRLAELLFVRLSLLKDLVLTLDKRRRGGPQLMEKQASPNVQRVSASGCRVCGRELRGTAASHRDPQNPGVSRGPNLDRSDRHGIHMPDSRK